MSTVSPTLFGVDQLLAAPERLVRFVGHVAGRPLRLGLVTNDAARTAQEVSRPSRLALLHAGLPIVRLFGPEHGLQATAADGTAVTDGVDALTGLPVVSLYGARMRPTAEQLHDLDAVLFDVPDVGARFYTYTWTLYHLLAACEEAQVPAMVLDRPNPLGGDLAAAEGPILEPACRSFVGEDAIPIRHACTLGTLARLWQRERFPHLVLDVISCTAWDATRAWPATGRPWVPTSPAMPTFDSAIWYPGLCLFEATNLSVGRGTTHPFQWIGAPWLDAPAIAEAMQALQLPAVRCEVVHTTPTLAPYADVPCAGVRMLVDHPDRSRAIASIIRPVALGLQLMATILERHPLEMTWAPYITAANPTGANHLARLLGRPDADGLLSCTDATMRAQRIAEWTDARAWRQRLEALETVG